MRILQGLSAVKKRRNDKGQGAELQEGDGIGNRQGKLEFQRKPNRSFHCNERNSKGEGETEAGVMGVKKGVKIKYTPCTIPTSDRVKLIIRGPRDKGLGAKR